MNHMTRIGANVERLIAWKEGRQCPTCEKLATHAVCKTCQRDDCPVVFAQKRARIMRTLTGTGVEQ